MSSSFHRSTDIVTDEVYALVNYGTGKVVNYDIANNEKIVEEWYWMGGNLQSWKFEDAGDGYYFIKSCYDGKVISVPSDKINKDGVALKLELKSNDDRKKWSVSFEGYQVVFTPKSNSSMCMSVGFAFAGIETNGINIEQRKKSNILVGNKKYFNLYKQINIGMLGVNSDSGHNHTTCFNPVANKFVHDGYYYADKIFTNYISAIQCMQKMDDSDIFITRGHGGGSGIYNTFISLYNDSDEDFYPSYLYSNGDASNSLQNYYQTSCNVDLSRLKLVIFAGCNTGAGGETGRNLPNAAVACGAEVAIGFETTQKCKQLNYWIDKFTEYFIFGYTVNDASNMASLDTIIYFNLNDDNLKNIFDVYIAGNRNLRIEDIENK